MNQHLRTPYKQISHPWLRTHALAVLEELRETDTQTDKIAFCCIKDRNFSLYYSEELESKRAGDKRKIRIGE